MPSIFTGVGGSAPTPIVAAPLTMPQQHIYMQLADPWTTPDFTEITPFIKQWNGVVRGRQHELQLFQPGQVALTLESNLNQGRFNPWNTNGPYYNLLTPDDAAQISSNGSWGSAVNCTIVAYPATVPIALDNGSAIQIGGNGSSSATLRTGHTYSVTAGNWYSVMASFLASSVSRQCSVGIQWYNSSNAVISTVYSSPILDFDSEWLKASLLGVQAPAGAVNAAVIVQLDNVGYFEAHWICRAALFNYTNNMPNTAWGPGQRGLVPARPMYCTAQSKGINYQIWYMYVSNFTPNYGQTKSEQVINCSDALALFSLGDLSSSAYANQVLADGATNFWRLGDPPESFYALDSGPGNTALAAALIDFGQTSPLLTDDTTVASFGSSSSTQTGYIQSVLGEGISDIGNPAQTLELLYMLPNDITAWQTLFFNTTFEAQVWFNPTTNGLTVQGGVLAGGHAALATAVVENFADGNWHHLVVTSNTTLNGVMSVYLDGVEIAAAAAYGDGSSGLFDQQPFFFGQSPGVVFQGSMGDIAAYGGVCLTPEQVANHYTLFSEAFEVQYSGQRVATVLNTTGWPMEYTNIATGISMVQSATTSLTQTSVLSYLQSIESTELGALFVDPYGNVTFYDRHYIITAPAATENNATFSNRATDTGVFHYNPGLIPAMDDTDLWNDVPAQANGGVLQRTINQQSIQQYGRRSLTGYTGELQSNDFDVLAQTQWLVEHYSTPYTRCRSITLSSRTDVGANLPQMLGRQIFDLITLIWNPIDGSTVYFDQQSLIESIQHTVTQDEWLTTWMLTPAETQSYMILNSSTYGTLSTDNRLGY